MKIIYFLIILLSSLQSYSIYAVQQHPLARLWGVDDTEVPKILEIERNLISIYKILRPILDQYDFISSFGGTNINIFKNHIVIYTVNYSKVDDLLALPQITPHEAFLYFDEANNSMSQINSNFGQIEDQALSIRPKNVFIYTDMKLNNNVLYFLYRDIDNTEFIDATKPFNPIIRYARNSNASQNIKRSRYDVDSRNLKVKVLGGDGLYNDAACSVGFWAINRFIPDKFYIITSGHCFVSFSDVSYLPWGSRTPASYIGPIDVDMKYPIDFGLVSLDGEEVIPTFSIRNDDDDQYKELIVIYDTPVSTVGGHICKSGYKTHLSCGYVFGLNGIYVDETGNGDTNLIITNMHGSGGDSGGAVFSFGSPQNLHSVVGHGIILGGGPGFASAHSLDSIFDELEKIFNIHLKLYLEDSGGS
ncbi:S1 family peptidase [Gigaspora margarita]|uniref:S1 family peptidase n=1 Tax=Gigaspora margarita TaxID=4874 RepID=A0A8H4A8R7_GIGMA|nr:S1 family peptidase [Gigaspora margarita]